MLIEIEEHEWGNQLDVDSWTEEDAVEKKNNLVN